MDFQDIDIEILKQFESIDCVASAIDWKQRAFEKIQQLEGFQLLNVPIHESGPLESAADRKYSVNIVGYKSEYGVAEIMYFIPSDLSPGSFSHSQTHSRGRKQKKDPPISNP